uniref:Uncharacterized protein n=1 Tax=Phakopsora pachyrhizi TaxID=170000 RepID=A0A0S1MIC9_PHAPC
MGSSIRSGINLLSTLIQLSISLVGPLGTFGFERTPAISTAPL